jgi:DNA polymerase elongation subunit (family B)
MEPIIFQIIDWNQTHESEEQEPSDELEEVQGGQELLLYKIRLFGRTNEGKSIFVNVENFTPYFFIEIPTEWDKAKALSLINYIKSKISNPIIIKGFKKFDILEKKKFYGFTGYKNFKFIRLEFINMKSFKTFEYWIERNKIMNTYLFKNPTKLKIYESNIEPFIRCMHIKKLNACGWVKIDKYSTYDDDISYCEIAIRTNWTNLNAYDNSSVQKFVIASYDIECMSESGNFPQASNDNDPIIQIGTVFSYYGESEPFYKNIITLGGCEKIKGLEDVEIQSYKDEKKVLLAWTKLIQKYNPDIITGYNINGFDFQYIHGRAKKLGIVSRFSELSKIKDEISEFKEKKLSSSALGDNLLKYFEMNGRVIIDLMKVLQRDEKLDSFKLDYVASYFIKEKIINYTETTTGSIITTDSTYGIKEDDYINVSWNDGLTDNKHDEKYKISVIEQIKAKEYKIHINGKIPDEAFYTSGKKNKTFWCHAKDDVSAKELFKLQKGSDTDRGIIAKYCIMDCVLVTKLMEKTQVLNNNIGMANVCSVPLSYIFMRGQGVKIFSLVSKKCRELEHIMPKLKVKQKPSEDDKFKKIKKNDDDDEIVDETGYEGAIVFPPVKGVHYEPIPVLDYASLYPRSMILINISQECYVIDPKYDSLADYDYQTVTYNNNDNTTTTCRFAKKNDGTKGILPLILIELLEKRSITKKLMEKTEEIFLKNIYDGLQLAYKVTANSLYGQVGAPTSPIYMKELAASTTATGRRMLELSRDFIEGDFGKLINYALHDNDKYIEYSKKVYSLDLYNNKPIPSTKFIETKAGRETMDDFIKYFHKTVNDNMTTDYKVKPKIIYGDTDSVFFSLKIHDINTKEIRTDRNCLPICIELGKLAGATICKILPDPQEQVYEKTLWPFIILAKKKYVGNLYEDDDKSFKQKSMGIVLKRRDNAKIVKIVVGGIVDYILNGKPGETSINERNKGAINYTRSLVKQILRGEFAIDKYIVSKTLRADYKHRTRIVHAVLADRIAERDPGNKPDINDRIPYVYVITKGKIILQGDRVEDPKYVLEHKLELDYLFYITNQIMKPSLQFLELIAKNPFKLFDEYIKKEINRRKNVSSIMDYVENNDNVDSDNISYSSENLSNEFTSLTTNKNKINKSTKSNFKNEIVKDDVEDESSSDEEIKKRQKNNKVVKKSLTIEL